jgi:transcriptional regulator with XRE-family HTH domain
MPSKTKAKSNSVRQLSSDDGGYGRLAEVVRVLLDDSRIGGQHPHLLTGSARASWAEILGVSRAAISQWVTGKTIPRPEHFRTIIDVLEGLDDSPDQANARALDYLYGAIDEPMALLMHVPRRGGDLSVPRKVIAGRLGDYVSAPATHALCARLASVLSGLTYPEQLRCLSEVGEVLEILQTESDARAAQSRNSRQAIAQARGAKSALLKKGTRALSKEHRGVGGASRGRSRVAV